MEREEILKMEIDQLRDQIRTAPAGTPHRKIYELYVEIDKLEHELKESGNEEEPGERGQAD